MLIMLFIAGLLLLIPFGFPKIEIHIKNEKVDERTVIFSRAYELKPETEKYRQFYKTNPQLEEQDLKWRKLPGLLSPKSLFFDQAHFDHAQKYGQQLEALYPKIEGSVNSIVSGIDQQQLKNNLEILAKSMGAHSLGFTQLQPYHFYTHTGRFEKYGQPILQKHGFAIAVSIEMKKERIDKAPYAPVVEESTRCYLEVGKIAVALASFIREQGYDAKAHIDANYEVICPLVARDAGLGELGRMGLHMTPKLGSRVRLAVVSTTFEFDTAITKTNYSLQYFCRICKKCAQACPSKAIPDTDLIEEGKVRYRINHEKCFEYWCKFGTDCARCMSVCPYSHPNNLFHNMVRWFIRRNPLAAKLALLADNYFYGKVPKSKK